MEKPFDTKDLVARLKGHGLDVAEELAEVLVSETMDWAKESCMIHPNSLVKAIGVPAVEMLKPIALKAVDKIDGKEG